MYCNTSTYFLLGLFVYLFPRIGICALIALVFVALTRP